MTLDFVYESLEQLWGRALVRPGALKQQVQEMSKTEVERLKGILGEVVQPYIRDGVIHLPTTPLCAAATK